MYARNRITKGQWQKAAERTRLGLLRVPLRAEAKSHPYAKWPEHIEPFTKFKNIRQAMLSYMKDAIDETGRDKLKRAIRSTQYTIKTERFGKERLGLQLADIMVMGNINKKTAQSMARKFILAPYKDFMPPRADTSHALERIKKWDRLIDLADTVNKRFRTRSPHDLSSI